ncbi:mucin-17 [Anopheles aquasalis]|uniref:mucin-17 n=1 Tax=Anopheles aquasalis TaxID=42839 RepID=UPI00215AB2F0|nr:mucin-17 [Anopheles aquasalis]
MASSSIGGNAKSDTSRRPPAIKNPLLSSQLTGLTLDDFAPVAVLPPAAPLPPIVREPPEATGHPKPVIFSSQQAETGAIPELPQDTDSFSEIDLSVTSDPQSNTRPPTATEYNPLQDLEESDSLRGGGGDRQGTDDGSGPSSYFQQTSTLTAQFAAQLPTVASTVFSTFSRVIKGSSPVPTANGDHQPLAPPPSSVGYGFGAQQEFQNTIYPPPPSAAVAAASSFGALASIAASEQAYPSGIGNEHQLTAQVASEPPPPPPTFYNPEQVKTVAATAVQPPPSSAAIGTAAPSNSYRLGGSKKKTYAHIPGLSTTAPSAQQPFNAQNVATPPISYAVPPVADVAAPAPPPISYAVPPVADVAAPAPPSLDVRPLPVEAPPTKGKPSLFGYQLPTNLLEKLPKPSFVGEKRDESVVAAPPSAVVGSIADQFADQSFTSGSVGSFAPPAAVPFFAPAAAPPPSAVVGSIADQSLASGPVGSFAPPAAVPFFAAAAAAAASPPPVFAGTSAQSSIDSFPAISQPQVAEQQLQQQQLQSAVPPFVAPAPPPSTQAGPPPTFYAPGQIPSVPVAPIASNASKNPYSSARRAPGVGPYKNPLAPVSAPSSGPFFLPNQLPPSAVTQSTAPPSAFIPPAVAAPAAAAAALPPLPPSQAPAPVSIFNPVASTVNLKDTEQSNQKASEDTTTATQQNVPAFFNPATAPVGIGLPRGSTNLFNVAEVRNDSEETLNQPPPPVVPFVPSQYDQLPNSQPILAQSDHGKHLTSAAEQSSISADQFTVPSASKPESIANVYQEESSNHVLPPVAEFNSFFDTTPAEKDTVSTGIKTIVDGRSKSSENVLSPPPRPNSNLSEPATIFPGAVPPAGIFLSENIASSGLIQTSNTEQQRWPVPDSNANSISSFFALPQPLSTTGGLPETTKQAAPEVNGNFWSNKPPHSFDALAQKPKPPSEEPCPVINPSDFFNSNSTAISTQDANSGNSINTGQQVSSVPLFNFFGRPAPTAPAVPAATSEVVQQQPAPPPVTPPLLVPEDQADGSKVRSPNDTTESEQEEQRFVGVVNEPIFSSDNLFDFKSSAYQEGGTDYRREQRSSEEQGNGLGLDRSTTDSMAALARTSVGAPDTTMTTTTAPSVAESTTNIAYRPTYNHWFYRREVEGKVIWSPFTMADSMALEDGLTLETSRSDAQKESSPPVIVHTDGGRYDVSIRDRTRTPVYWKGTANEVRRCSWFYKNVDSRFVPYEEEVADLLESVYKEAATTGEWHRRVTIPNGETVVFHGPSVIVHFLQTQNPDTWGSGSSPVPSTTNRPRVVKRGIDEFNIDDDEPEKIDHLMFMVHGIGEACDLRFRRVEEVVDEFRSISAQLVQSHYRSAFDRSEIGRVEILPISWHDDLHSEESGVDEKLKSITLDSIPKLRHFTNDTLLDVLFYTSPMFCQSIIDAVGNSLNRLYTLFCQRNPSFAGGVSLAGHSLGSLILFDLLCHQKTDQKPVETENSENPDADSVPPLASHVSTVHHRPLVRKCSQQINYEVGPAGTGQPYITYPQLLFRPKKFFALGSPIGMFVTIRGIDALGLNFALPTCDGFFNIFHPYDPVAYRIEALVNPELSSLRPVLIPHHKGRKRMHLELKETMVRVGNDLKQRVSDVFRNTLDTVYALTALNTSRPDPKAIEKEVDKVLQDQLKFETTGSTANLTSSGSDVDSGETSLPLGRLNQSRRVDYVLQEAPFEFINEYLFALTSHVCYWDSEDTMLFLMKEIYSTLGVQADIQVPQQSMTIERPTATTSPTPSNCSLSNNNSYNLYPQPSTSAAPPSGSGNR